MATRNLTEVFLLMRNNAIRNRHIYAADKDSSEHMQLVSLHDVEQGENHNEILLPPFWTNQLEDAHRTLKELEVKLSELKILHRKHLDKSTFDESTDHENLIEYCSCDITAKVNIVHKIVQSIKSHSFEGSPQERKLTRNVVVSIATSLQDVSTQYRSVQSQYLKQLKSREDRSKLYFENPDGIDDFEVYNNVDDDIDEFFMNSKRVTQQQLLYLEEENTKLSQQREEEVNAIVKSILDLNDIFKDLSQMVADQGSILDRIDYNVEQTQVQVYEGYKQLQKADAYSRKNRKMCAIIVLSVVTVVLVFLLVLVKF